MRPENTLPAFEYAIVNGVDAIELDMQVTKDGVIVISHDPFVNPEHCVTSGGQAVPAGVMIHDLTLEQVQSYDCGSKKNPHFPTQIPVPHTQIPRLSAVFELVKNSKVPNAKRVQFNIETKSYPGHPEWSPDPATFAKKFVNEVKAQGMLARTMLESFDNRTLRAAHKLAPKLRLVLLTSDNHIDYVAAARAEHAYAISPDYEWITADDVKSLHAHKVKVIPWTVDDPSAWTRMMDYGVDGIITDDPAALIELLVKNGKRSVRK